MNDNNINNNNNDEFDDLKSLWQNQAIDTSYDKDQIFKMIHRKSINSVQWLFILSIVEFFVGICMSVWPWITNTNSYPDELMNNINVETYQKFENFSHYGLIGSLVFISITFYFYRKISSKLSVADLIKNIINFRRSVIVFIITWLVVTISILTPLLLELGTSNYIALHPNPNVSEIEIQSTAKVVGWTIVGITIGIIILFCAFYYGIIYGIFLRRLGKNLKELKKIA